MANKTKTGLTYFPFEVNFFKDIKLRKLIKYQGCKATPIYTLLLCNIYENGYYLRWDNELPFMISETTGYEEGYIKEVITCCLKIGLFSEKMFDESKIITSKGIQERYQIICKQIKRKINITEYNLIDSEELGIVTERMPIDSEELLQRKVKESKEKEIRVNTKISEIENSQSWVEGIAMQNKINPRSIDHHLKNFLTTQLLKDEIDNRSIKEIKSHFVSWVKIEAPKQVFTNSNHDSDGLL